MGRTNKKAQQGDANEKQSMTRSSVACNSTTQAQHDEEQPPAAAKTTKQQSAAVKQDEAAMHTKKRAKDEIDEIFRNSKKGQEEQAAHGGTAADESNTELHRLAKEVEDARKKAKRPKVEGSKDDIFGEQAGKPRKRTEEGYAIYAEEELGLGKKGGDTPLCPFDCDCCY